MPRKSIAEPDYFQFELVIEAEILDEFQDLAKSPEYARYKQLVKERQAQHSQPQ